jgi:hypothetical protein
MHRTYSWQQEPVIEEFCTQSLSQCVTGHASLMRVASTGSTYYTSTLRVPLRASYISRQLAPYKHMLL